MKDYQKRMAEETSHLKLSAKQLEYLLSVSNGFTAMTYQKRMRCVEFWNG